MKQWDRTVTSNSTTKESALSTTITQPWRSGKHAPRACCSLPSTTLTDSTAQVSHPPLTPGQSRMSSLSLRPPYIHQLTNLPSVSPSGSPHSRPRTRPRSSRMSPSLSSPVARACATSSSTKVRQPIPWPWSPTRQATRHLCARDLTCVCYFLTHADLSHYRHKSRIPPLRLAILHRRYRQHRQ